MRVVCIAALWALVLVAAPTRAEPEGRQRSLLQSLNWSAGTKFGPPENYFSLRTQGGPYSSIQGTRTTDVKVGSPPRPPVWQYSYNPKRSDSGGAKEGGGDKKGGGRRLSQSLNWSAGTKFGPPENYFSLRSQGGPYSSIQGTRTTDVKVGSPPRPPVWQYSYNPKRSDSGGAKEGGGDKKGGGRRLSQSLNWSAGTKFGPPENYFSLRTQGGPYSSIQGTRTTDVKVGSPPRPPVWQYSYNPKRSDSGGAKEGGGDKKGGGRRLTQSLNWSAGTKFGPPENYFSLRTQGGPYSSIQGTRTTDVKVGSPPRPPVWQYSYNPKRSDSGGAKEGGGDKKGGGRRLSQSLNWSAGTKFGPPENYFSLRSQGGPYSSIQGTRTTDVKVGSPPRPPVWQYSYNPKRSDSGGAKEGGGDKKGGGRRLSQSLNWSAGTKFGPPENYFSLRTQGGPYSSIQGTRKTDVKVGSPPRPPVWQYSYNPKRSSPKSGGESKD